MRDPKDCMNRPFRTKVAKSCDVTRAEHTKARLLYDEAVMQLKLKFPSLIIFDPKDSFCDLELCYAKDDQNNLYFDQQHLSLYGSEKVMRSLLGSLPISRSR